MKQLLQSYHIFSDAEIDEALKLGSYKTYKKGDFFVVEGLVCQHIGFIQSGIFRSFHIGPEEDTTYCISFPNDLISAYTSYLTQEKSTLNIRALTDAELFVIPKTVADHLARTNANWLRFFKTLTEQHYMKLENRVFELQRENAATRYINLVRNQPNYIEKIPLQYLASYLGITQRHLSRLRANISF